MIVIGAVASAHGVRGQFKVKPFTDTPEDVAAYGPVCLEDGRRIKLKIKGRTKQLLICSADEITDRGAAEALKGQTLSVDRSALPVAASDELYHADLIGLAVADDTGQPLGQVAGLHNFGAGEILEVRLAGQSQTELYPFYPPFLHDVDLDAGQIVLAVKAGQSDEADEND